MAIPKAQLETWANPGALTTSAAAYASIRHALLKSTSPVADLGLDIYLQGSYGNSTNIYADSDIDVVALYTTSFYEDLWSLTAAELLIHSSSGFGTSTYNWTNLRDDVLKALRAHYGYGAVKPGKKAIKVTTGNGLKPADVVPAMQFRRYATFPNAREAKAHWGIKFFDSSNNPIVNYPKYHLERGEDKNSATRTGGRYKPTIRIFKNFRNYRLTTDFSLRESLLHTALNVRYTMFLITSSLGNLRQPFRQSPHICLMLRFLPFDARMELLTSLGQSQPSGPPKTSRHSSLPRRMVGMIFDVSPRFCTERYHCPPALETFIGCSL
jgi:hypothetical protein